MVDRKVTLAHSYSSSQSHWLPALNILQPPKRLVADQRAYSPLLKRERLEQRERRHTDTGPTPPQRYQHETVNSTNFRRSETRPLLVFMQPFVKKVLSLHERLLRELGAAQKVPSR
jgi:hypothetical protein